MSSVIKNHRVVVTGMGLITPLGIGLNENWNNMLLGKSAISSLIDNPLLQQYQVKIGGKLHQNIYLEQQFPSKIYSLANQLTELTLEDSQIDISKVDCYRTGVIIGSQNALLDEIFQHKENVKSKEVLNHMIPATIAKKYKLKGQIGSGTYACATSTINIGQAYRLIKYGYADVMIAGGLDINLNNFTIKSVESVKSPNIQCNDNPKAASQPFDKKRNGAVLSDGGGLLILENLQHAIERQAKNIYCEIVGFHNNCEADHLYKPNKVSLYKVIREAMLEANLTPRKIDFINAHAASTIIGDECEAHSIKSILANSKTWDDLQAFKEDDPLEAIQMKQINKGNVKKPIITAFKGQLGHLGCGAGSVETIFGIKSMIGNQVPQTYNLQEPLDCDLNFAINHTPFYIKTMLKISSGFGIINAALILQKIDRNFERLQ